MNKAMIENDVKQDNLETTENNAKNRAKKQESLERVKQSITRNLDVFIRLRDK